MNSDADLVTRHQAPCDRCGTWLPTKQMMFESLRDLTLLVCRDNEGCEMRVQAREEAELAQARKIGLSPEEAAADNQGGLNTDLLDLFCDYRESTLLGQITAILTESGYHGALLARRLEEFRASQYFRNLIEDYRAHISRVG